MGEDLTRRDFLMGAAAMGSIAALGMAGCAPQTTNAGAADKTETAKADAGGEGGGEGGGPGGGSSEPTAFSGLTDDGRVRGYCGPGDWLGAPPTVDDADIVDEKTFDVVVFGGGHAGLMAACGAVDEGATVAVIEMQPWSSYVDEENTSGTNLAGWYGEDIGHVNSQFLIERGFGPYNTGEITAEFCKRAGGRVNPGLLRNYVQSSGPMFDRYKEIYDGYEADRLANDSAVFMKDTQVVIPGVDVPDEGTFDMSNMFEYPLCNTQATQTAPGVNAPSSAAATRPGRATRSSTATRATTSSSCTSTSSSTRRRTARSGSSSTRAPCSCRTTRAT